MAGSAVSPEVEALMRAIERRRSIGIGKLKDAPVDRGLIEKMLEAANWGQSHEDTEPWRFCVFMGEGRQALAEIFGEVYRESAGADFSDESFEANRQRAFAAPVWISIGMVPGFDGDGKRLVSDDEELMAVATAVQNMHLVASALGLAGMWHSKGLSVDPGVGLRLGLESPSRLLGFFRCGWPTVDWPEGERGPVDEKVKWL